jgi:hypothetical protein
LAAKEARDSAAGAADVVRYDLPVDGPADRTCEDDLRAHDLMSQDWAQLTRLRLATLRHARCDGVVGWCALQPARAFYSRVGPGISSRTQMTGFGPTRRILQLPIAYLRADSVTGISFLDSDRHLACVEYNVGPRPPSALSLVSASLTDSRGEQ